MLSTSVSGLSGVVQASVPAHNFRYTPAMTTRSADKCSSTRNKAVCRSRAGLSIHRHNDSSAPGWLSWMTHLGKQESATHPAGTYMRTVDSYHLHLQFSYLFIQTLHPGLFTGVVREGQLGVCPERGRLFPHPPEQTLGGLPADFRLYVFEVWDALADSTFVHRHECFYTDKIRRTKITSFGFLGYCSLSSCESHFLQACMASYATAAELDCARQGKLFDSINTAVWAYSSSMIQREILDMWVILTQSSCCVKLMKPLYLNCWWSSSESGGGKSNLLLSPPWLVPLQL